MTQGQLAQAMGFDSSMVSRVESGEREPTADFVIALARALGLDQRLVLARAGLADEPMEVNEATRAELLSVFDTLTEDDQLRLIELAKGMKRADAKLQAQKGRLKGA